MKVDTGSEVERKKVNRSKNRWVFSLGMRWGRCIAVAVCQLECKPSRLEQIYESIRDFLHYALEVFASILVNRVGASEGRSVFLLSGRGIKSRCPEYVASGLSVARSAPMIGYGPSVKNGGSMVEIGKEAPSFILEDSESQLVKLEDFRGKKVVLWFYPKDDTPGCTKEACEFRDAKSDFEAAGAVVVGISPDEVSSHQRFREKYDLPLILLADPKRQAIDAYGVWREKNSGGKTVMGVERSTFLIDEQGVLIDERRQVVVDGHVEEMLAQLG